MPPKFNKEVNGISYPPKQQKRNKAHDLEDQRPCSILYMFDVMFVFDTFYDEKCDIMWHITFEESLTLLVRVPMQDQANRSQEEDGHRT